MSPGALVGIIIAAIVALAAVLLWLFFACRRWRRHNRHPQFNGSGSFGSREGLGNGSVGMGYGAAGIGGVRARMSPLQDEDSFVEEEHGQYGISPGAYYNQGPSQTMRAPNMTEVGMSPRRLSMLASGSGYGVLLDGGERNQVQRDQQQPQQMPERNEGRAYGVAFFGARKADEEAMFSRRARANDSPGSRSRSNVNVNEALLEAAGLGSTSQQQTQLQTHDMQGSSPSPPGSNNGDDQSPFADPILDSDVERLGMAMAVAGGVSLVASGSGSATTRSIPRSSMDIAGSGAIRSSSSLRRENVYAYSMQPTQASTSYNTGMHSNVVAGVPPSAWTNVTDRDHEPSEGGYSLGGRPSGSSQDVTLSHEGQSSQYHTAVSTQSHTQSTFGALRATSTSPGSFGSLPSSSRSHGHGMSFGSAGTLSGFGGGVGSAAVIGSSRDHGSATASGSVSGSGSGPASRPGTGSRSVTGSVSHESSGEGSGKSGLVVVLKGKGKEKERSSPTSVTPEEDPAENEEGFFARARSKLRRSFSSQASGSNRNSATLEAGLGPGLSPTQRRFSFGPKRSSTALSLPAAANRHSSARYSMVLHPSPSNIQEAYAVNPSQPSPSPTQRHSQSYTAVPGTGVHHLYYRPRDSANLSTESPRDSVASSLRPGAVEGLLDPSLALRLRQLRDSGAASVDSIGLRDHEDYSRPIGAVSLEFIPRHEHFSPLLIFFLNSDSWFTIAVRVPLPSVRSIRRRVSLETQLRTLNPFLSLFSGCVNTE